MQNLELQRSLQERWSGRFSSVSSLNIMTASAASGAASIAGAPSIIVWDALDVQNQMRQTIHVLNPPIISIYLAIKVAYVWFNVKQGCPIEHILF